MYRIYVLAQRDGIDYNLAYIPVDFHPKRASEFDTKYMNQEFEMAYNLARSGYKWSKYPPGFEPVSEPEKTSPPHAQKKGLRGYSLPRPGFTAPTTSSAL